MPSKAVLISLHVCPLALFGKNFLTLLGLALLEGVGSAHTSRITSDGFVLQKLPGPALLVVPPSRRLRRGRPFLAASG